MQQSEFHLGSVLHETGSFYPTLGFIFIYSSSWTAKVNLNIADVIVW